MGEIMKQTIPACLWIGWYLVFGSAQSVAGSLEVVQSVPVETTLAVPGVRTTQAVWLEMIQAAQHQIDFEQMYLSEKTGEALTPVVAAIQAAASRGVRVRFLADAKFFTTYPETLRILGSQLNIEARTIDYSRWGGIQHAKYFVVDGQQTYVGSANFDWRALDHIHEVGLRVADSPVASAVEAVFNQDWAQGVALVPTAAAQSGLRFLDFLLDRFSAAGVGASGVAVDSTPPSNNPSGARWSLDVITNLLASARRSVQIQVYDYSIRGLSGNWTVLDSAIRQAALRGVRVQLMVDAIALKKSRSELASLAQLPNVEVRTVIIPAWSGGAIPYGRLVHSKYLVIDSASAWVGTANWSEGYFLNTRNVGLVTEDPQAVDSLVRVHNQVWMSPYATALH